MKKIIIIDGYSVFFRSYYAMPKMIKNGKNLNAVYGFLRQIFSLIKNEKPTHMIVTLDSGGDTFRKKMQYDFLQKQQLKLFINENKEKLNLKDELINKIIDNKITNDELKKELFVDNEELRIFLNGIEEDFFTILCFKLSIKIEIIEDKIGYKKNRVALPQDFREQFSILDDLLNTIKLPNIRKNGYEADDIIATIALSCHEKDDVLIVSSDKDIMQLINGENVSFYDVASKKNFSSIVDVKERFGVKPNQIPDYLALLGDTSDNIPGVPGIGKITAANIINEFDNIEKLIKNVDIIKNEKIKNSIINFQEQIEFAKKMTILEKIEDIKIDIENSNFSFVDQKLLNEFNKKYEEKAFKTSLFDI